MTFLFKNSRLFISSTIKEDPSLHSLTIYNTGSTNINGWSLTFSFANGQQISQSWNATYVQSGNLVTLTNASYDGCSIGFLASTNGTNTAPTTFKLNGVVCS